jgi:DNA polymerase
MLGSGLRVTKSRGELLDWEYRPLVMATIHPSAVLRAGPRREQMYQGLVSDLRVADQVSRQGQ